MTDFHASLDAAIARTGADTEVHEAALAGDRVVCSCGDTHCASLDYTACSFALGNGQYCQGDVRFPATHATLCPGFSKVGGADV